MSTFRELSLAPDDSRDGVDMRTATTVLPTATHMSQLSRPWPRSTTYWVCLQAGRSAFKVTAATGRRGYRRWADTARAVLNNVPT
jgi:hypothetical protein